MTADRRPVAERLVRNPAFLAAALWPRARQEPEPWAWLAEQLGIPGQEQLAARVLLCRAPRGPGDVDRIASHFGVPGLAGLLERNAQPEEVKP